jgi:hypothetical protein
VPSLNIINNNAHIFKNCGSVVASYRTRGFPLRPLLPCRLPHRRPPVLHLPRPLQTARRPRPRTPRPPPAAPRLPPHVPKGQTASAAPPSDSVIRQWQQTIRAYGLDLRGCEIRGWRRLGIPRYDKTTPYTAAQKACAAIFRSPLTTRPAILAKHHPC